MCRGESRFGDVEVVGCKRFRFGCYGSCVTSSFTKEEHKCDFGVVGDGDAVVVCLKC